MIASRARPKISLREPPPVFNKRLFKAQAGIVITDEIVQILQKSLTERRLPEQLHAIKPVVSALKDIHKGLQFIKEALSHVVTYEKVDANTEISKKWGEKCLSCYYILTGSVEANYSIGNDIPHSHSLKKSSDCEINYTHVAGEYLGLVSGDGPQFDYPPPDCVRTIEASEFLRVDRNQFHRAVKRVQNRYVREIETFFDEVGLLKSLPSEEKNKLVSLMARQEYPAGKVIISQGDIPEHVFFVAKGRCQYHRRVFIDEINREELVKLGQIEKGEFFGESSALFSSPCFCSVASIGRVTCFLVNNWAIKTNEHFIRILGENRRYFFSDSDIKRYIRDSDIWQSYKRCTVTGLLEAAGKCHMNIKKEHMTPPLTRAVDYGDAKRSSLNKPSYEDEIPGAPKKTESLFVPPRSRRRASAILNCSAAAVVKAVLLLRLKPEEESSNKGEYLSFSARGGLWKERGNYNEEWPKPRSAPGRNCAHPANLTGFSGSETRARSAEVQIRKHQSIKANKTSKRVQSLPRIRIKIGRQKNTEKRSETTVKSTSKGNSIKRIDGDASFSKTHPVNMKKTKENTAEENHRTSPPATSPPAAANEKSVTRKPNVVVKEIINTGIPGRRMSPTSYRRFQKSMFGVLDQQTGSPTEEPLAPHTPFANPWSVSFATTKWISAVRQQRRAAHPLEMDDVTGQPPIIVIEDWSPETESGSEGSEDESGDAQSLQNKKIAGRRASRTPSPALDNVAEENEEEVQKYENDNEPQEIWYTSIHEARDTCQQQLDDVRKEVESLVRLRKSLKSQQKKEITNQDIGNNLQDETEYRAEKESKAKETEAKPDSTNKTTSRREKQKPCRRVSVLNSHVGRSRARTMSEAPDGRHNKKPEHCDQLRRTQSLSRFRLIHISTPNQSSQRNSSLVSQSITLEDQPGTPRRRKEIQRISVEPRRLEKRRELLRKKLEEIAKKSKNAKRNIESKLQLQ